MITAFKRSALVAALALSAAATAQAATTTLTFSEWIDLHSSLNYTNTVGGNLKVTASSGSLAVVLGELGVAQGLDWLDWRINSAEAITFTFQNQVTLIGWDMDDANLGGSNKFGLRIDGTGPVASLSLDSYGPASTFTGKSFTFSHKGDAYFIDRLTFGSVTAVPEPSSVAMLLAGLGVAGLIARRRKAV